MRRLGLLWWLGVLGALCLSAAVLPRLPQPVARAAPAATAPHKVVLILEENHEYGSIVGSSSAPYINDTFIPAGKLFTNYYAIEHPSLPNYLDITSGQNSGCTSDSCARDNITANNIYKQLTNHGYGWQDWNESMDSNCQLDSSGDYAVKHNPPPYFTNLAATACPNRDIPYPSPLPSSLRAFTLISPDLCSDMHDCSVSTGDTWLSDHVPALLNKGAIVAIVFDEGTTNSNGGGHVMLAMVGPGITAGTTSNTALNHYGLLRGLEAHWNLPYLAKARTATAVPIP